MKEPLCNKLRIHPSLVAFTNKADTGSSQHLQGELAENDNKHITHETRLVLLGGGRIAALRRLTEPPRAAGLYLGREVLATNL
jgi:hypothetical protein